MKKSISAAAAVILLLLLLSHPSLSFQGACQGLLLWFHTVLPTLLPFMLCSNVIVMTGGIPLLAAPFRLLFRRALKVTDAGGYVLLSGLLCGYPMGAKTCSEFLSQGRITAPEARYLLAISNHPSPMFLLGYVAGKLCPAVPIRRILLSLYLPLFLLAWFARHIYHAGKPNVPMSSFHPSQPASATPNSFDDLMMSSFEVMVRIGGYMMIFSIAAVFVTQLAFISPVVRALFLGLLEITTGIQAVSGAVSGHLQGLLLTLVIAFGGICGIFQTKSVLYSTKNAGLSIRHYILWKIIHALFAGILYLLLAQIASA